jgi:hypothetical protein
MSDKSSTRQATKKTRPSETKRPVAKKTATRKLSTGGSKQNVKKKITEKPHSKLIRDSFTIPEDEYVLLAETKKTCLKSGLEIKKSQLIRIGIRLVHELGPSRLKKEQKALQPVKTGRPHKS